MFPEPGDSPAVKAAKGAIIVAAACLVALFLASVVALVVRVAR